MGLLAVPRATVGRAKALGDARYGRERRKIGEGLERREYQEARAADAALGGPEGRRALALAGDDRHGVIGRVPRPQERPGRNDIERDRDRADRRERVTIEKARGPDIAPARPALRQRAEV